MTVEVCAAQAAPDLPLRIISYAWGDAYLDELLSLAIPALLAPGNLPYVASQVKCELTLVTEERLFGKVAAHPAIVKAQELCPVRLVGLDDLVTRRDQYGMALTYALHRAFADLGPGSTDCWLMFLNADFILADGSLRNLLGHLRRGARIVAAPSYCTVKEAVLPELRRRLAADPTQLAIAPRELARVILQHRHNTIRGKTINQDAFHLYQADQFYWALDDDTLLGHQMPVSIVGMRPERFLPEPNSLWDHGLISELCPTADVNVLGDSDEFLMLELRSGDVAADQIVRGRPDPKELANRMITWVTPYQASFARRPLTLHAANLPPSTEQARLELDNYVAAVLSHAPPFPSHLDHPQWMYHWPNFMRARHAFLSSRLRWSTAGHPPPRSMTDIDKLWWRLDGAAKSLARQQSIAAEERDREIERARAMHGWDLTDRAYASMILAKGSSIEGRSAQDAEAKAEQRYRDLVGPLEAEHARLLSAYEALLLPRVKSAAPAVQWGLPSQPAPRGPVGRAARFLYHSLFGRWPQVTMLNPFWAPLQPLLRTIEAAKAAGARDALIVSDDPRLARELAGLSGKVARVTKAGFTSGEFRRRIEPRPQFDLFVVEINREELFQLHDIVDAAKPYLRPDCTVVAFHMSEGRTLDVLTLPRINGEAVFAGSEASIKALSGQAGAVVRILSGDTAALHQIDLSRLGRSFGVLIALPLHMLQFWRANRAEARATRQGREARYRTSVTITARAPWLIGEDPFDPASDDDTVDFAASCGAYLGAPAEAPIDQANRVGREVAYRPDTAVILTFGQSNAANAGAGRYVARHRVHAFNIFDMHYYKAVDPLPGATNDGGSVWGRLGDKLVEAGVFQSVLFVPIAVGGSYIKDWSPPDGYCYRRLLLALTRLKRAGINIDMLCWHQGEADANRVMTTAEEYTGRFRRLLAQIRRVGVEAPVYVAVASHCANGPHPFRNHEQVRLAQRLLVSPNDGLLPGPDTDQFTGDFREDGCHFSEKGLDAVAQAWLECIVKYPLRSDIRECLEEAQVTRSAR